MQKIEIFKPNQDVVDIYKEASNSKDVKIKFAYEVAKGFARKSRKAFGSGTEGLDFALGGEMKLTDYFAETFRDMMESGGYEDDLGLEMEKAGFAVVYDLLQRHSVRDDLISGYLDNTSLHANTERTIAWLYGAQFGDLVFSCEQSWFGPYTKAGQLSTILDRLKSQDELYRCLERSFIGIDLLYEAYKLNNSNTRLFASDVFKPLLSASKAPGHPECGDGLCNASKDNKDSHGQNIVEEMMRLKPTKAYINMGRGYHGCTYEPGQGLGSPSKEKHVILSPNLYYFRAYPSTLEAISVALWKSLETKSGAYFSHNSDI